MTPIPEPPVWTVLDDLIAHARADALLATGGRARRITDAAQRRTYRIGFAAGRLKTLEELRNMLREGRAA